MFKEIHPILGTQDLEKALDFYLKRLGFDLAFRDRTDPSNYAGVRRGGVELHLQWQDEREMSTTRLRILVENPDTLFEEYNSKVAIPGLTQIKSTPWGTREFAIYDADQNSLTFYRDLVKEELGQR